MTDSLEEIQDGVLEQLHAGEPIDRQRLLAAHPEHVEALAAFLTLMDEIEQPPPERQPMPSRLGDFRILSEIGRGGMGVVYEAEQVSLGRRVALKLLPPALQHDRRLVGRFRREAEAAGRLRHPNIVPVYACGEAGGTPFFAMERVQGTSLAQIIEDRREGRDGGAPVEPAAYRRWALDTLASIADALHYAHGEGILHRDTKPANILVDDDGTPRLSDFGVALDLEAASLTASGEVLGSPQYMSPEQAFRKQRPLDARSDIYSLGVTLYELLTLRLPYEGTTSSEIMGCLHAGEIVPPRSVDAGMSRALERVLLRALAADPDQRYTTADELAADLRALLDDRPLTAANPRRRWGRRLLVAMAAVALLLLAIAQLGEGGGLVQQSLVSLLGEQTVTLPTHDALEQLLGGTHADALGLLSAWIEPRLSLRHVVARDAPAALRVSVPVVNPGYAPDGTLLLALAQVSLNGGAWRSVQEFAARIDVVSGLGDGSTYVMGTDLRVLGEQSLAPSALVVRARVLLRALHVDDAPSAGAAVTAQELADMTAGSGVVLSLPERTVLVYDHFPEDYPERLGSPTLDAAMARAWTPARMIWQRISEQGDGVRSLLMTLEFDQAVEGALTALASDVALYADGAARPFATANCSAPALGSGTTRHTVSLFFELSDPPVPDEQRIVLELAGGRLEHLRVVITPSRAVALADSDMELYWGGSIDATVDVELP
ncbi:MAG: hypothetical protein DRQ55_12665 [Planctomycetota bacterium]|nr:MAG: hypothetical protein DRQ55_12665 [Planctomycetota bacterium]